MQARVVVDCAAGVGAQALATLQQPLASLGLHLDLRNTGDSGPPLLNEGCGADFVQKARAAPEGFSGPDLAGRHAQRCPCRDSARMLGAAGCCVCCLWISGLGCPSMRV